MTETIDHQGGTSLRAQQEGQRVIAALRMALINEVSEGFLNGMRSAGVVPTPAVRVNCQGMAQAAVDTVLKRVRCIQTAQKVEPGDTLQGETTQGTIDRLVKPALSAASGDALLSAGLMGVQMLAPSFLAEKQEVVFVGTAMVIDGREGAGEQESFMQRLARGGAPTSVSGVRS